MAKHTNSKQRHDELAFPVRLKVVVPPCGFGRTLDPVYEWLTREVGTRYYAWHNAPGFACSTAAFYFRSIEVAQSFVTAFPELVLADGTQSPAYLQSAGQIVTNELKKSLPNLNEV